MTSSPVIGLEIHVQLGTRTRLFSRCPRASDTSIAPNLVTDPVTLGLPGTLPSLNERAVALAVRLGLAFGGQISIRSEFDRKHYFYPDLPRNYQITQERNPIVRGGCIPFEIDGVERLVPLIRCHLEEDAGRSVHEQGRTRVDFNRAGTALLEIVTEPALSEPREAAAVMHAVRELVRWLEVNDGSLEEGQLRCDANVSLGSEDGSPSPRVELKNLNSIKGVARAIEFEVERQRALVTTGEPVEPQTRGWDAERGETFAQRGKETTADYRFLAEPDLGPLILDATMLAAERAAVGELPGEVRARWRSLGMEAEAARVLTAGRGRRDWCDGLLLLGAPAGELGRWGAGDLLHRAREAGIDLPGLPWSSTLVAGLLREIDEGGRTVAEVRSLLDQAAPGHLEAVLLANPVRESGPLDDTVLRELLARHPGQVAHYRAGKTGLLGWFVAEARNSMPDMRDPAALAAALRRLLTGDDE